MRKAIFSAVVVMLAGACWVLAQNASNPLPPPDMLPPPMPKGPTSGSTADVLVLPPTDIAPPAVPPAAPFILPPLPPVPTAPLPPFPSLGSPPAPPSTLMPVRTGSVAPSPAYPVEDRSGTRSIAVPAVPGLPLLPAVPGASNNPPGLPSYVGPVAQGDGRSTIVPDQPPNDFVPAWQNPQPVWTDTDPNYWNGRRSLGPDRTIAPRIWASADYLLWFAKPEHAPPLVQGVFGARAGDTSFNQAQSVNLSPAGSINYQVLPGVRGTLGGWLDPCQSFGLEGNYFWFGTRTVRDTFASSPDLILGRPFFNVATGNPSTFLLSSLNGTNGFASVHSSFQAQGGEANLLFGSTPLGPRFTFLTGFRYLAIDESVRVNDYTLNPGTGFAMNSVDLFSTRNQFFGGQIGAQWSYQGRRLFASVASKIAFGEMEERVRINGASFVALPDGSTAQTSAGVLALPSNIGNYYRTRFAVVPEVTTSLGYRFTSWATGSIGYNFLYASDVARPGKQIDPSVNPQNFPFGSGGGANPQFRFRGEDMWLQGLNFSLMFHY